MKWDKNKEDTGLEKWQNIRKKVILKKKSWSNQAMNTKKLKDGTNEECNK